MTGICRIAVVVGLGLYLNDQMKYFLINIRLICNKSCQLEIIRKLPSQFLHPSSTLEDDAKF
ncbi:hypothetical protein BpHYR1_010983 [Brachionus plicatilis]|uniref:Uncharacterized protein n=1 Tax=Brachionus plicatilis TaxID=10195 RepID=A0A3M7T170_BRAPC|nr:hypothetical protein BpHYR1_010983 [Brachionus plicatilis]